MNINITYSLERNHYLEWSIKNWGDKSLDILSGNFSGFGLVFCHIILCQVDQPDGWDFLSINSKEFWDTAVVFNISVNKHKENLSFEFLGCGWKCFLDGLEIFSLFACKEQNMLLNISSKDLWCILEEDKMVISFTFIAITLRVPRNSWEWLATRFNSNDFFCLYKISPVLWTILTIQPQFNISMYSYFTYLMGYPKSEMNISSSKKGPMESRSNFFNILLLYCIKTQKWWQQKAY